MLELLLLFIYKVTLDVAFWGFILPIYGYEPYLNYGILNSERLLFGYALLPLLWVLIKPVMRTSYPVSRLVLMVQFLIIVLPMLTLFGQVERPVDDLILILCGFFTVVFLVRWLPAFRVVLPSRDTSYLLVLVGIGFVLYVYGGLILTGGLSRLNFNFYEVYSFREQFHENILPLYGYIVPWVAYVINMAFLIYAVEKNRSFGAAIVIFFQVILFGMTNFKAFLFVPFVVITLLLMMRRVEFTKMVFLGGAVAIALMLIIGVAGEDMGFGLAKRIFIVPSALHSLYFEFFSDNPTALLSGTHWDGIFGQTPYDQTTVDIVAVEYWEKVAGPNVGWMGDAFANFGSMGLYIYAILLSIFLKTADSIARKIQIPGVAEGLFIGPALSLCSSALNSMLLTHGGLVALFVLWVLTRQLKTPKGLSHSISHRPAEVANV